MAVGWKSIRGGRLYVDRFTRKVTSGREKAIPTYVSKCHHMAEYICKTTFLSDYNSVPIQRKSLHIRPVLCRKCIHLGWFFSLRILLWRSSEGLLSPEWPSGWLCHVLRWTWKLGWEKVIFGQDEWLTFGTQTFASRVATACNRGCIYMRPERNEVYLAL